MTFCAACGCHVEPVTQPAVHGWIHACQCKAQHKHLIQFVISRTQRDGRFGAPSEDQVEA